jgi:hypothetical protein
LISRCEHRRALVLDGTFCVTAGRPEVAPETFVPRGLAAWRWAQDERCSRKFHRSRIVDCSTREFSRLPQPMSAVFVGRELTAVVTQLQGAVE